ncbi:MAG TPA: hypothetical protein VNT55_17005 [Baekduia sp.]|nr:hypothetical protein [Baekduia sp.]
MAQVGFWTCLAAWKIAVISQGVFVRMRAASAQPDTLAAQEELVQTMLARAEMHAKAAGL